MSIVAKRIKMPLGTEVGLGPGDIVLDGDPVPHPPKKGTATIFAACLLWPNGSMYQDITSYGGRRHCVRWGSSSPSAKGTQPPQFSAMSVVAKWLNGLRCHLVSRKALTQATSCSSSMSTQLPQSPQKRAQPPPNFWRMSIVAEWIKMPLGMEVNLGQGDVLC